MQKKRCKFGWWNCGEQFKKKEALKSEILEENCKIRMSTDQQKNRLVRDIFDKIRYGNWEGH